MHPARSGRKRYGVKSPYAFSELLLKFLAFRAGGDPSRAQNLLYGGHFLVANTWAGKRKETLIHTILWCRKAWRQYIHAVRNASDQWSILLKNEASINRNGNRPSKYRYSEA
jgi:hypothetical protein